jgi:hypothetical protein
MKPAAAILPAVQASMTDLENWIGRVNLSTKLQPTVRGKARLYSRGNAFELALISAFVRAGATPSRAATFAASFIRNAESSNWKRSTCEFLVWPAGELKSARGVANLEKIVELYEEFGTDALSVVHVGKILRRVNSVFDREP